MKERPLGVRCLLVMVGFASAVVAFGFGIEGGKRLEEKFNLADEYVSVARPAKGWVPSSRRRRATVYVVEIED